MPPRGCCADFLRLSHIPSFLFAFNANEHATGYCLKRKKPQLAVFYDHARQKINLRFCVFQSYSADS